MAVRRMAFAGGREAAGGEEFGAVRAVGELSRDGRRRRRQVRGGIRQLGYFQLALGSRPLHRSRGGPRDPGRRRRSEEHTSELQSLRHLVCRLLLEKKNTTTNRENNN